MWRYAYHVYTIQQAMGMTRMHVEQIFIFVCCARRVIFVQVCLMRPTFEFSENNADADDVNPAKIYGFASAMLSACNLRKYQSNFVEYQLITGAVFNENPMKRCLLIANRYSLEQKTCFLRMRSI